MEANRLICRIDGETYLLDLSVVLEVVPCGELTELPGFEPWVRGVLNHRDAAVPVVDLRVRAGKPRAPIPPRACVAVMAIGGEAAPDAAGLLCDAVTDVAHVDPAAFRPLTEEIPSPLPGLVESVADLPSGLAFVLRSASELVADGSPEDAS